MARQEVVNQASKAILKDLGQNTGRGYFTETSLVDEVNTSLVALGVSGVTPDQVLSDVRTHLGSNLTFRRGQGIYHPINPLEEDIKVSQVTAPDGATIYHDLPDPQEALRRYEEDQAALRTRRSLAAPAPVAEVTEKERTKVADAGRVIENIDDFGGLRDLMEIVWGSPTAPDFRAPNTRVKVRNVDERIGAIPRLREETIIDDLPVSPKTIFEALGAALQNLPNADVAINVEERKIGYSVVFYVPLKTVVYKLSINVNEPSTQQKTREATKIIPGKAPQDMTVPSRIIEFMPIAKTARGYTDLAGLGFLLSIAQGLLGNDYVRPISTDEIAQHVDGHAQDRNPSRVLAFDNIVTRSLNRPYVWSNARQAASDPSHYYQLPPHVFVDLLRSLDSIRASYHQLQGE